ncbi:MAG TPA: hypothetical protein VGI60_03025 [Chthoniobacterales bacterium]|jgi:hypothetical protein
MTKTRVMLTSLIPAKTYCVRACANCAVGRSGWSTPAAAIAVTGRKRIRSWTKAEKIEAGYLDEIEIPGHVPPEQPHLTRPVTGSANESTYPAWF